MTGDELEQKSSSIRDEIRDVERQIEVLLGRKAELERELTALLSRGQHIGLPKANDLQTFNEDPHETQK